MRRSSMLPDDFHHMGLHLRVWNNTKFLAFYPDKEISLNIQNVLESLCHMYIRLLEEYHTHQVLIYSCHILLSSIVDML